MTLSEELNLRRRIEDLHHEALLSLHYTVSKTRKRGDDFFRQFGLTDVQFNALSLLKTQSPAGDGLTQVELGGMMLVNRANVTALIDRMARLGLVVRKPDSSDRRCNRIHLTAKGERLHDKVAHDYVAAVRDVMAELSAPELRTLLKMLERLRTGLDRMGERTAKR